MDSAHNNIIVVTGMTGVGKDYLIDRANAPHRLTAVGWGDMLSRELGMHKDVMMGALAPDTILQGQFSVCQRVLELQPLIAICHVIKPEDGRYAYNLPIEQLLKPRAYVFVSAPATVIGERVRQRNRNGSGRLSPELPVAEIDRIQRIKLELVRELAELNQSDFIVLNNVEEQLADNLAVLSHHIQSIKENHG